MPASNRPSSHELYERGPYVVNYIALTESLVLLIRAIVDRLLFLTDVTEQSELLILLVAHVFRIRILRMT